LSRFAGRATAGDGSFVEICGPANCRPLVGNVLVYRDKHHLTSAYALTTAPRLLKRLLKVSKTRSRA
jgi:hypothetical protein